MNMALIFRTLVLLAVANGTPVIVKRVFGARADHAVRHHDQPGEVKTLAQYRNRYALHHLDEDLAALHAASPAAMTWDDHEVQNDYAGKWSQEFTPMRLWCWGFAGRLAAAVLAQFTVSIFPSGGVTT